MLFLSIYVFDLPRYLFSTIILAIVGIINYRNEDCTFVPSVTIIIPIFNGEQNLIKQLMSIHQQSYQPHEIIIVNDGSSDNSLSLIRRAYLEGMITKYYTHEIRCGKSASLNHALRYATSELILTLDDDTILEPDAIKNLVPAFCDSTVAIAGGTLSISNSSDSLWTSIQKIEYLLSIAIGRTFLNIFGSVACVSGAFAMTRADILKSTGGFNVGPGEDLELTLRFHRLGYSIRHIFNAKASVIAPTTLASLIRQRMRWDRDSFNIRVNIFNQFKLFIFKETLSNTYLKIDFIFFELIPTIIFPFYICYLIFLFNNQWIPMFFAIYISTMIIYIYNFMIALLITKEKITIFDTSVLIIFPFYQGILMKIVRFYAYSQEILFASSQNDDYVPSRIRNSLYHKK